MRARQAALVLARKHPRPRRYFVALVQLRWARKRGDLLGALVLERELQDLREQSSIRGAEPRVTDRERLLNPAAVWFGGHRQ